MDRRAAGAKRRLVATVALMATVICLLTAGPASAQKQGSGKTSMIVTYRCSAANRPAFRSWMERRGLVRLERWRRDGLFSAYQVLFSAFASAETWDMVVILDFPDYAATGRWRELVRESPGGLDATGLALGVPVGTFLADRLAQGGGSPAGPREATYLVIPYEYTGLAEYEAYVTTCVAPQLDAWASKGILSAWDLYLNQHPAGPPWDALLVLEYRGLSALAQREVLKNEVRRELQANTAWRLISEVKARFRTELQPFLADALLPVPSSTP